MNEMRNNSSDDRWVEALDRELKSLPVHRAPASLIPRVLAAIETRAQLAWYRYPLPAWPVHARLAAAAVFLTAMLGSLWSLTSLVRDFGLFGAAAEITTDAVCLLGAVVNLVSLVLNALAAGLTKACGPFVLGSVILLLAMYACCIGCGTLLYRLTKLSRMKGVIR